MQIIESEPFVTVKDRPEIPTFRRYSSSGLTDIIYGTQPMSTELAEAIRTLRRDHGVDYVRLGFYLCESDPDAGASFGLGKTLVELASRQLIDDDPSWV